MEKPQNRAAAHDVSLVHCENNRYSTPPPPFSMGSVFFCIIAHQQKTLHFHLGQQRQRCLRVHVVQIPQGGAPQNGRSRTTGRDGTATTPEGDRTKGKEEWDTEEMFYQQYIIHHFPIGAQIVEEEAAKRIEMLVKKRVDDELERRKDEIELEVTRRVEAAKQQMEQEMMAELERRRQQARDDERQREVGFGRMGAIVWCYLHFNFSTIFRLYFVLCC